MSFVQLSGKLTGRQLMQLEKLYLKYCRLLKIKPRPISLAIIGDSAMIKLNKYYFNRRQTTDVLSFEKADEIIINYAQAKRQARQRSWSILDELSLLFVHACLHLIGLDHNNKYQAKKMSLLQQKILGKNNNQPLEY
jgi:rRNA maturation RNase YbeY